MVKSVTIPWMKVSGSEWRRNQKEWTHEVVETSFQTPEKVRVRRLGDVSNGAVGQDQVEANDSVDAKTILVGLVRVPYWRSIMSVQTAGESPGTNLRRAASPLRQSVK